MKGRRPTKPQAALGHRPSTDHRRRDSDASFTSLLSSASRPSLAGPAPSLDRSAQSAALKSVNLYLQSNSFAPLRPPLPSARDITAALQFLLARLDFPLAPGERLEDELPSFLRSFGCPVALKPSVIRTPSTPHAWPSILAVLQWLVQVARYADHTAESDSSLTDLLGYHLESYAHFARGDDDAAQAMDAEAVKLVEQQAEYAAETLVAAEEEVAALEARAEALRSNQSRQLLEKERTDLLEDVKKFGAVIESFTAQEKGASEVVEEKERILDSKLKEAARVSQENVELRKKVEEQRFNVRDVERMKKELAAVERDIAEAEIGSSAFEEQILELDSTINGKMKELEALASECNQAIKR